MWTKSVACGSLKHQELLTADRFIPPFQPIQTTLEVTFPLPSLKTNKQQQQTNTFLSI